MVEDPVEKGKQGCLARACDARVVQEDDNVCLLFCIRGPTLRRLIIHTMYICGGIAAHEDEKALLYLLFLLCIVSQSRDPKFGCPIIMVRHGSESLWEGDGDGERASVCMKVVHRDCRREIFSSLLYYWLISGSGF